MASHQEEEISVRPVSRSEEWTRFLRKFAEILTNAIGDAQEEWFTGHGIVKGINTLQFIHDFSNWKALSVGYYANRLMEEAEEFEVMDFDSNHIVPPTFDLMEYKSGEEMKLLTDGYAYLKLEGKPVILRINAYSYMTKITFWCRIEDEEFGRKLFDEFKKDVNSCKFLKNAKILLNEKQKIEFIDSSITRDKLILTEEIWRVLDQNLFYFLNNRDQIKKANLDWRRGLLIWGFPGTGKTLFGKVLCNEAEDVTMIWVTSRSIEDSDDVATIFGLGRSLAPCILFFEDIDFFAQDRDEGYDPVLGELLTQLDGIFPNEGLFVVGTTNRPGILDTAITQRPARFDVRIKFDLPKQVERERMFKLFLGNESDVDFKRLASRSERMTGAYIRESCVRGSLALLCGEETDLQEAIVKGISSLKAEEIRPYPTKEYSA